MHRKEERFCHGVFARLAPNASSDFAPVGGVHGVCTGEGGALAETAEMKKAQADLEVKYKARNEEFQKVQKEYQNIQAQLSLGDKLTQQAQNDLTLQAQRKQRDVQRVGEDLQADVDRERNDILTRTSQRLKQVLDKMATEKGLDVIIDAADTVFFKPALDLTKEATTAYDKAYPVK